MKEFFEQVAKYLEHTMKEQGNLNRDYKAPHAYRGTPPRPHYPKDLELRKAVRAEVRIRVSEQVHPAHIHPRHKRIGKYAR